MDHRAQALIDLYGPRSKFASLDPRQRWAVIELQQFGNASNGSYSNRLANIGARCAPSRNIR